MINMILRVIANVIAMMEAFAAANAYKLEEKIEKQEPVQEIVQIKEPEVKEEPEEVKIKVDTPPTRYYDHVYVGNIDVQIVEVDPSNTYQLQQIVDDPYKGVSYKYYHCTYVGDHSHEGFANLPYVQKGDNLYWKGKTYICYYADNNAYLDYTQNIKLSNGEYLYDQDCVALVTCKTDYTRYVRLFKEV